MRDLQKRLERLEQDNQRANLTRRRVVIQLIGVAEGGGPAPWDPQWCEHLGGGERIIRRDGESAADFETRAKGHFPEPATLLMGSDKRDLQWGRAPVTAE